MEDRQQELDLLPCRKEPHMYDLFSDNVTKPVELTLNLLPNYRNLISYKGYSISDIRGLDGLKPDFGFLLGERSLNGEMKHPYHLISGTIIDNVFHASQEIVNILALGEGQHPLGENRLMTLYNHRASQDETLTHPADGVYHAIQQLYGYMIATKNPFGMLSSYEMTWFLSAIHAPGKLAVSRAISHNATRPTLLRCVAYTIMHGLNNEWEPAYGENPTARGAEAIESDEQGEFCEQSSSVPESKTMVLRSRKHARDSDSLCIGSVPHTAVNSPSVPSSPTEQEKLKKQFSFNWPLDCATFLSQQHQVIGEGASGHVVLWKRPGNKSLYPLDDALAVKRGDYYQQEWVKPLRNESRIYQKLQHLQIRDLSHIQNGCCVPFIWHHGQVGPYYCLIMTYIGDGALTLGKWLKLKPDESRQSLVKKRLIGALRKIHEAGILHGDIRHQNIFVLESDQVVLIDFAFSTESTNRSDQSMELKKARNLFIQQEF